MDCLEGMKKMEDNSVDSIVTDPPYGLSFMGKKWDYDVPSVDIWKECLRVLKPGGYLLSFAGTRTQHRMACNIEDAGFEIRDMIAWVYGCLSEDTEILTPNGWEHYHRYKQLNTDRHILIYDSEKNIYKWEIPERWSEYKVEQDTCYRIQSNHTDQIVSRGHRCIVERDGRKVFIEAEALECEENIPFLESVPELSDVLCYHDKGTGFKKSILPTMCRESYIKEEERKEHNTFRTEKGEMDSLSGMPQKGMETQCLVEKSKDSNLQLSMQRKTERRRMEETWVQRKVRVDRKKHGELLKENVGPEKSCLERRGNIFQEERELWEIQNKICPLSERIYRHVEEGWVCNGTQIVDGSENRKIITENRSDSSHRPQSRKQQHRESSSIQDESGSQEIRGYGITKAKIEKIKYTGLIFCPTVSTGAFVARRNGKIFITGNSGFPKSLDVSKAIDKMGDENKKYSELSKSFCDYLKTSREKLGLSQKDIAKHFLSKIDGLTGCVWNWENGASVPTMEQWSKLKNLLKLTNEKFTVMIERAILKRIGAEREVTGKDGRGEIKEAMFFTQNIEKAKEQGKSIGYGKWDLKDKPSTPEAKQWEGWGTALKPALEPITVARKPFSGTVAENVLKYGTGGINIDGCRIEGNDNLTRDCKGWASANHEGYQRPNHKNVTKEIYGSKNGRFPANLIHDGSDEVEALFPEDDGCSASRFFYCAKASKSERNLGLEHFESLSNDHATVKPLELMKYLIKLVTQPKGIVLDPFMGSGSTGLACKILKFKYIGFDTDQHYIDIANTRIKSIVSIPKTFEDVYDKLF